MDAIGDLSGVFSFESAKYFLLVVPFILILLWELNLRRKRLTVALTDLEFLRSSGTITGKYRHVLKVVLWILLSVLLGIIWAKPVLHTTIPVLSGGEQTHHKNMIIAIDISRSMGQPLEIPDKETRFANFAAGRSQDSDTEQKISRYESARNTLYNFIDRFDGSRIGLILFSTEPFLARWPTTETDQKFIEVMEEKLGPGERSQLQRLSSLTNIDEALRMTRDIFAHQSAVQGGAVILISDAEDELENMGIAIRLLRSRGIRLYTIGVGISEVIVEKLSAEFTGDPGFRIFHVESEEEMEEAYDLVSELEESPAYADDEQEFITDIRWLLAGMLVVVGVIVIILGESLLHQSWIADRQQGI